MVHVIKQLTGKAMGPDNVYALPYISSFFCLHNFDNSHLSKIVHLVLLQIRFQWFFVIIPCELSVSDFINYDS